MASLVLTNVEKGHACDSVTLHLVISHADFVLHSLDQQDRSASHETNALRSGNASCVACSQGQRKGIAAIPSSLSKWNCRPQSSFWLTTTCLICPSHSFSIQLQLLWRTPNPPRLASPHLIFIHPIAGYVLIDWLWHVIDTQGHVSILHFCVTSSIYYTAILTLHPVTLHHLAHTSATIPFPTYLMSILSVKTRHSTLHQFGKHSRQTVLTVKHYLPSRQADQNDPFWQRLHTTSGGLSSHEPCMTARSWT